MTLKARLLWLLASAGTFLACCVVMLRFGQDMNSRAVAYPFVALWGVSALAWPMFLILSLRASVTAFRRRPKTR